jgi:hypothetical protein
MLVAALILMSLIVTIVVASLSWPIGSLLSGNNASASSSSSISGGTGLLYVHVTEETFFAGNCSNCPAQFRLNGPIGSVVPIPNVDIFISSSSGVQVSSNFTDLNGKIYEPLKAGAYNLVLNVSGKLVNIPFIILSKLVTSVDVFSNNTVYPVIYYDFYEGTGSGYVGNWQSFFVLIPSAKSVASDGSTIEVDTLANFTTFSFTTGPTSFTASNENATFSSIVYSSSATILGESVTNASTTWIQLQPTGFLPTAGVYGMDLLNGNVNYTKSVEPNAVG